MVNVRCFVAHVLKCLLLSYFYLCGLVEGPFLNSSQQKMNGIFIDLIEFTVIFPLDGYMSSPERGTRGSYEEPYYSQYGTRGNSAAPIIDEELRFV